jgi:hypothetical protein
VVKQRVFVVVGLGLVGALAACSALIGTRDLTLEAADSGATGNDGSVSTTDGSITNGDGSSTTSDSSQPGSDSSSTSDAPPGDAAVCSPADLLTDALNCGTCGHSCLGGQCSAGVCQAFTLVAGQFGAGGIAVDDAGIYWTTTSTPQVLRANTDGTGIVVLGANANWYPLNVAVDGTYSYWVDDSNPGSILRCGKGSCDAGPAQITPSLQNPNTLRSDGQNVYWTEYSANAVGRVRGDGGAFGYLATQLNSPYTVEVDDASVYFGTADTVARMPKGAPSVADSQGDAAVAFTTVASVSDVFGMSFDSTNLYWAVNDPAGSVQFTPKGGTGATPQSLSAGEVSPIITAVDATNVYWTAQGPDTAPSNADYQTFLSGYVATCPKTGCPASGPTMLATGLHNPYGIAVDDTAIYFTIFGNSDDANPVPTEGAVMKIAK